MDPEDPNYPTEITRQLLVQGKAGTLNQFTFNPSNIFKIRLGEGLQRRENWTLFPERGKSRTIRNDEEDSRDLVPGPQEEAVWGSHVPRIHPKTQRIEKRPETVLLLEWIVG